MHRLTSSPPLDVTAVALTPFLFNLSVVLVGLSAGGTLPGSFQDGDLHLANPVTMLMAVVISVTVAVTWRAFRHVTDRSARVRLVTLVAYQAVIFTAIWLVLPRWNKDALPLLAGVCVLCVALAFRLAGRPIFQAPNAPARRAVRFIYADLAVLMVPLLIGWFVWDTVIWMEVREDLLIGLLTYPLYAFLQLLLFLALPATLLQRLGVPSPLILISLVLSFALLHAPNPTLTLATGLAMLIWSRQWLQGRSLWAIALIMGLAAAPATHLLPGALTGEMRIGPDYLDHRYARGQQGGPPAG